MKKLLISISLLVSFVQAWAVDTYNPENGQLTIPTVLVGDIAYSNVVITVGKVLTIKGGTPVGNKDNYDLTSNVLLIPSVLVGATTYTNVAINVDNVLSVGGGLYKLPAVVSNLNESFLSPSLLNTLVTSGKLSANNYTRNIAFGDLNSDGCTDVVTAPYYYMVLPNLPLEIWKGDCNGKFELKTADFISGLIPTVGMATSIFINDFQNNGKNGIFIVDSGNENLTAQGNGFTGGKNHLLLPKNGKLVDVSETNIPDNGLHYNHVSAIFGNPGQQEIVLTRMGGYGLGVGGIYILKNDGSGNFIEQNPQTLPAEFYSLAPWWPQPTDYIQPGTSIISELNNDGQKYLIIGTYSGGTIKTHITGVFIYKLINNNYTKVATIPIPLAYANIGYKYGDTVVDANNNGLGVSGIVTGDFENSGHKDIAVIWEGSNKTYLQIIQNQGNDIFNDVTTKALAGMTLQPYVNSPVMQLQAKDVNEDGIPELILKAFQYPVGLLDNWSPIWQFKNGKFNYYNAFNGSNSQQIQEQLNLSSGTNMINFFFEDIGNGKINAIGLETSTSYTSGTFNLTGSSISHVLIRE